MKIEMISASEIFYFYLQSLRKLKAISKSPFYKKSPEKLAVVKWKKVRGFKEGYNPQTGKRIRIKNVGYVFSNWAKDHFYYEGDEICFSVTGWDYRNEDDPRRTIYIYSPKYIKENTTFYIYRDYEERCKKVTDIHELIEDASKSIESIFQLEQKDVINSVPNVNQPTIKRQSVKRGRIKVDHLRWDNYVDETYR